MSGKTSIIIRRAPRPAPKAPAPQSPPAAVMPQGWQCPLCQRVYAPEIVVCSCSLANTSTPPAQAIPPWWWSGGLAGPNVGDPVYLEPSATDHANQIIGHVVSVVHDEAVVELTNDVLNAIQLIKQ